MSDAWGRRNVEIASGLTAGLATTLVAHPLDLIKVRLQFSQQQLTRPFGLLRDVLHGISVDATTAQKSGLGHKPRLFYVLQQCYRGVGPNLVGNVSAWAMYFTLYADLKNTLPSEGTANYFAASSLAGAITSIVTNPIWMLKTRILSTSSLQKNSYKNVGEGIREIYKKEGILTFWRGSVPSLFSVFQASLQFTIYDHTKSHLSKRIGGEELPVWHYVCASVFSKIVSMTTFYPAQVFRSRLQGYNFGNEKRTLATVLRDIYSQNGLRGFYRGLSANVLRVLPSTVITFVSYETTKKYLSL